MNFQFCEGTKKANSCLAPPLCKYTKVCLAFKHKDGTWYRGHRFLLTEKYISHNKRDVTLKAERIRGSSLLKPEEIETYVFTVFEANHSIYHKRIQNLKTINEGEKHPLFWNCGKPLKEWNQSLNVFFLSVSNWSLLNKVVKLILPPFESQSC